MSSNKLNLNNYILNQLAYNLRDANVRFLNGQYYDALQSLWATLEMLPKKQKEQQIEEWITEIQGLDEKARKAASGSTSTQKEYSRTSLRILYSKQLFYRIWGDLFENLHEIGLFELPFEDRRMVYPSLLKKGT